MKKILPICFFFGIIFISSNVQAERTVIAVILGKIITPYNQALSGFKEKLAGDGYQISQHSYSLKDYPGQEEQIIQEVGDLKPALIFTIGTRATLFAKKNFPNLPIVFSMVLNPVKAGVIKSFAVPESNLTGASLDILPEIQFKKLKELQPNLKRVGVIYNANEKEWLKNIEMAAKKTGLLLIAQPISSESDVPIVLDEIHSKIDALWAQTDATIYNAQSAQHILLTLIRHKIPLMAFSASYVKAGALLALECNYVSIGRQAGQAAVEILAGKSPSMLSVSFPEELNLVINKRISEIIEIDIPANMLKTASEVYK